MACQADIEIVNITIFIDRFHQIRLLKTLQAVLKCFQSSYWSDDSRGNAC